MSLTSTKGKSLAISSSNLGLKLKK